MDNHEKANGTDGNMCMNSDGSISTTDVIVPQNELCEKCHENIEVIQNVDETQPQIELTDQIDECSICLSRIEYGFDECITDCKHRFHLSCILKSTHMVNNTCPLCRKTLVEPDIRQHVVYEDLDDYQQLEGQAYEEGVESGREQAEEGFEARGVELYESGLIEGRSIANEELRIIKERLEEESIITRQSVFDDGFTAGRSSSIKELCLLKEEICLLKEELDEARCTHSRCTNVFKNSNL